MDNGLWVNPSTGKVQGVTQTYTNYQNLGNNYFIAKGTLENVITGKELVSKSVNNLTNYYTKTEIDNLIGPLDDVIDAINGEVI